MQQHDIPADPCINICRMDLQAKFCQGCMRTPIEIGRWNQMSSQEKIDLMAELERRRAAKAGRAA